MNRIVLIISCTLILFLILKTNAYAAPQNKNDTKQELSHVNHAIKKTETEKSRAISLAKQEEKKLKTLQVQLIDAAKKEKNIAQDMDQIETQIQLLQQKQKETNMSLVQERQNFSNLLIALQRLTRTPPEAFMVKPGAPIDSARAHLILKSTIPVIKQQADMIANYLKTLEETEQNLKEKQKEVLALNKKLKSKKEELEGLIQKRKNIYKEHLMQSKEQEKELNQLLKQATTLQDLLSSIEKQERLVRLLPTPSSKPKKELSSQNPPSTNLSLPSQNISSLPVVGKILLGFGDKNEFGITNKGLIIEARSLSTVTIPFSGIVRFSGTFKKHQNILIVEHNDGSMSMLDGLESTNVVVGQSVLSGEPVGTLKKSNTGNTATLYYELRKNGKPINPIKRLSTLAKSG